MRKIRSERKSVHNIHNTNKCWKKKNFMKKKSFIRDIIILNELSNCTILYTSTESEHKKQYLKYLHGYNEQNYRTYLTYIEHIIAILYMTKSTENIVYGTSGLHYHFLKQQLLLLFFCLITYF